MRSGVAAEFSSAEALMVAVKRLVELDYRALDTFTPHPIHGLEEVLRRPRSRINWTVFPFGMGGALLGFGIQAYCNGIDYPLNVGGRPPISIPAFIPITFESGVLASGLVAFFALFWVLRLPHLSHPLFALDGFDRASVDRFWLAVDARDPLLDYDRTAGELYRLGALQVASFGGQR